MGGQEREVGWRERVGMGVGAVLTIPYLGDDVRGKGQPVGGSGRHVGVVQVQGLRMYLVYRALAQLRVQDVAVEVL